MGLHSRLLAGGAGAFALAFGTLAVSVGPAGAIPASAVNWTCFNNPVAGCPAASFNGYATGSELYLSALAGSSTQVADVDQGFSGASTASAGLTHVIDSETGALVQPSEPSSVRAYGTGSGFELGANTATIPTTDQNTVLAGRFQQTAPPDTTEAAKQIGPVSLPPVAQAALLTGDGDAVYSDDVCPIGQPLSYGLGDAAGAGALDTGTAPLLSTAGTGTSVAQTTSQTYLTSNGDGTFGISTQASDIIAPISVNLPGGVDLSVAVQSAGGVDDPVSLTARTTGESSGASLKLSTDDVLTVKLGATTLVSIPLSEIAPSGVDIPLSTNALGSISTLTGAVPGVGSTLQTALSNPALSGLLTAVNTTVNQLGAGGVVSLGNIRIDTAPHVIGSETTAAKPVGGTAASGALDLLHVHLGLSSSLLATPLPALADLYVGHLETAATQTAPIVCNLPVIKSSSTNSVVAGQSFTYNIEVPNPADLGLIDCDLDNITVTDTISDLKGTPSFQVTSAVDTANSQAGTIHQTSPHNATVTWTGLTYKVATSGPPNAPIPLTIALTVPSDSVAGLITDTVNAVATTADCRGGAEASTAAAAAGNGASLTGAFTLPEPSVTGVAASAKGQLPFTGAMGGLWQPVGGLAALGVGAGALALVGKARRRQR